MRGLAIAFILAGLGLALVLFGLQQLTPDAAAVADTAPVPPLVTIPQAESASPGPTDAVGDGREGTITVTDSAGRQTVRRVPPGAGDPVVGIQIPPLDLTIQLADGTTHALAPAASLLLRATLPAGQADTPDLRRGMLLIANPQPRSFCGAGYDLRRAWPVQDILVPCEVKPGDGRVAYLLRYELTAAVPAVKTP